MTLIHVCDKEDVQLGEGIRIVRDDLPEPIGVFNYEGEFFALSDTCSHGQASLADGEVISRQVVCPLHWGRFDLETGRACVLPALRPVTAYPVSVEGERVFVSVPRERGN